MTQITFNLDGYKYTIIEMKMSYQILTRIVLRRITYTDPYQKYNFYWQ